MLNNSPNRLYFENGKLFDAMVVDQVRQTAQQRRIQRRQLASVHNGIEGAAPVYDYALGIDDVTPSGLLAYYAPDSDDEGLTQE